MKEKELKSKFNKIHETLAGLEERIKIRIESDFYSLVLFKKELDDIWKDLFEIEHNLNKESNKK